MEINQSLMYGAHMSISKGFAGAAKKTADDYKANALQIFLKSPRGKQDRHVTDDEGKAFQECCKKGNVLFAVGHCSYLLNFTQDVSEDPWTVQSLISDLKSIHKLGGAGIVLHIGKYLKLSKEDSYANLAKNIAFVLRETAQENNFVILENTAGQGTEIGWRFDELEHIYKNVLQAHPRIRFCFDTAHAFAAGYDLRNETEVNKVFDEFDTRLGVKNIALIHFNDSQKDLGSRVDRHANLGAGLIKKEGLLAVARFAIKKHIPLILETPGDEDGCHFNELETLRSWL